MVVVKNSSLPTLRGSRKIESPSKCLIHRAFWLFDKCCGFHENLHKHCCYHLSSLWVHIPQAICKEWTFKVAKKLVTIYKVSLVRLTAEFAAEITEDRRQQDDMYKELKEIECLPRILYTAKISFKNGDFKAFPD